MKNRYILLRVWVVLVLCGAFQTTVFAQPACVVNACCCGNLEEVGIPNGNFEDPPNPPTGSFDTYFGGQSYSTWSVLSGSIDVIGPNTPPYNTGSPSGSQSIDLNGFTAGTIATTLNGLMPGSIYTIVLWYAKNPGGPSATCNIQVAGGAWLNQTWTSTNNGNDDWLERCFTFTAQGTTAELRLIGSSPVPAAGMMLDDITMWKCPQDMAPPTFGNAPQSPLIVECSDPFPDPEDLSPTDDCSAQLNVAVTDQVTPQPCQYNVTRRWTVTDECGNTATTSQLIQVVDTEAPVFTVPPSDYTAACGDPIIPAFFQFINSYGNAIAEDNCDPDLFWSYSYAQLPSGLCKSTPVVFTVRDDCGNTASEQANFIVADDVAPELIFPAENVSFPCDGNALLALSQWLNTYGGAQATDPCGPVTWTNDFNLNYSAPVITVTFTASDFCSNSVATTATFTRLSGSDTLRIDSFTCDALSAGADTVITFSGLCELVTITKRILATSDTLFLTGGTCDTALAGVFVTDWTNQYGCDSVVVQTIALWPSFDTTLSSITCVPANAGVFTDVYTTSFGCDSIITRVVTLAQSDTVFVSGTTCNPLEVGVDTSLVLTPDSCFIWFIESIALLPSDLVVLFSITCNPALAGMFTNIYPNQYGCDSVVTQQVQYIPLDTTFLNGTTCDLALAGVFVQTLSSFGSCDSVVVNAVLLLPGDSLSLFNTTCDPSLSGTFVNVFSNQSGCDSVVTQLIQYIPLDTTFLNSTTCDPALAGVFVQTLTSPGGCDSVVANTILLLPSDTLSLLSTTCDPALSGSFVNIYPNQFGCDSVVTQQVQYIPLDTTFLNSTTCDPALAGVFVQTLSSSGSCDSVVVNTILLLPSDSLSLFSTTCDPAQSGTFVNVFPNQYGCDSVVTQLIQYIPLDTTFLNSTTCDPALAGVFVQTLSSSGSCDSVVVNAVLLLPGDSVLQFNTTCDPAQSGTFVNSYPNQYGCDSVVVNTVSLLPSDTTVFYGTTCDPSLAGTVGTVYQNQYGCDSLVLETISLLPTDTLLQVKSTCDPGAVGVVTSFYTNQYGCDSTVRVVTTLFPLPELSLEPSNYNGFGVSCFEAGDGIIKTDVAGVGPFQYDWSVTGQQEDMLTDLYAGDYALTLTDGNGCTDTASAFLSEPPPLQAVFTVNNPDCFDQAEGQITINAQGGVSPYQYALNGLAPQSDPVFNGLAAGGYNAAVSDANGCTAEEILLINTLLQVQVDLGDDWTIEIGDNTQLEALVNVPYDSLAQVVWSLPDTLECPECLTQEIVPLITSAYSIRVVAENGCSDADTVLVKVNREKNVYAPNVFSPNDDGRDDRFHLFAKPGVVRNIKTFQVYDRWGSALFRVDNASINEPEYGWDGAFRGQKMNPGVYIWYVELEYTDGSTEILKGDILLAR
jgi:gliding motility-associated-like protein